MCVYIFKVTSNGRAEMKGGLATELQRQTCYEFQHYVYLVSLSICHTSTIVLTDSTTDDLGTWEPLLTISGITETLIKDG